MANKIGQITAAFFNRPVAIVAKELLGHYLYLDGVGGMLTETEAYDPRDPASHSFHGLNEKNEAMFGEPGTIYVYIYRGMWHHLNIVCEEPGSAVLLRALRPTMDENNLARIIENRRAWCKGHLGPTIQYCSGPGKLGTALGLKRELHNFALIDKPQFILLRGNEKLPIVRGTRINVPKNPDAELRWAIQGCHSVSKPFEKSIEDGFTLGDDD